MNFDCRSLFVGDLPNFCSEHHLRSLFQPFQPVLAVHFHDGTLSGRDRSYAFVMLGSFEAVEAARKHLDGCLFLGAKIKVRRATTAHSKHLSGGASANSVYVRFSTSIVDQRITEFDLHRIFSPIGLVQDVLVKDCHVDLAIGQQYGYAFVHYATIQSALKAAAELSNTTVEGLALHVEPSRGLLRQAGIHQQLPVATPAFHDAHPPMAANGIREGWRGRPFDDSRHFAGRGPSERFPAPRSTSYPPLNYGVTHGEFDLGQSYKEEKRGFGWCQPLDNNPPSSRDLLRQPLSSFPPFLDGYPQNSLLWSMSSELSLLPISLNGSNDIFTTASDSEEVLFANEPSTTEM
eukprot:gene1448-1573_t